MNQELSRIDNLGDLFFLPIINQLSRILSQIDRNPHSPTYGSCCRNYWHYRIEDISNSQFQEVVLTLALIYFHDSPDNPYFRKVELLDWIAAILDFTTSLQNDSGSFDEVYKGQDSYAATAFVSFCVSETLLTLDKLLDQRLRSKVLNMLVKATKWLSKTQETFTANQIAGAALVHYNVSLLIGENPYLQFMDNALQIIAKTQTNEGWFREYGGADIGYDSLTQSYLSLVHFRSGNKLAGDMAIKSLNFLQYFLHEDGSVGGEFGSRNTEYFIPTGAIKMAGKFKTARRVVNIILKGMISNQNHLIPDSLDDRYLCYLSPHYMIAAKEINSWSSEVVDLLKTEKIVKKDEKKYFPKCKLCIIKNKKFKLTIALGKGGVFLFDLGDLSWIDSGIFGKTRGGSFFTSQQLILDNKVQMEAENIKLEANIYIHKPIIVSPWKNLFFKFFNLITPGFLRRVILDLLRKKAATAGRRIGCLIREFIYDSEKIIVSDYMRFDEPIEYLDFQMGKERALSFASTGFSQQKELNTGWKESHRINMKNVKELKVSRVFDENRISFSGVPIDVIKGKSRNVSI